MQAPKSERKKKAKKRSDSWYRYLIFVAGLLLLCGPVDALSNLANSLGDLIEKSLSF
jgi:lauroyl/myristoyl acyltransferase